MQISHPMSTPSPLVRTAWLVVILLMPVALLNYLDRQMLAAMKSSVMGDIPSIGSEESWGFMLGQFKWVYAFLSPIGGYVADRFSRRWTICSSLFVWSAVTWWTIFSVFASVAIVSVVLVLLIRPNQEAAAKDRPT